LKVRRSQSSERVPQRVLAEDEQPYQGTKAFLLSNTSLLTKSVFVHLARWKSVRNTPNYESNDEAVVSSEIMRCYRDCLMKAQVLGCRQNSVRKLTLGERDVAAASRCSERLAFSTDLSDCNQHS
jgi:hypothetical protein